MTEEECNARLAAMSVQVSILHNALRGCVEHLEGDGYNAEVEIAQGKAALNVSESDCADLLRLARETAEDNAESRAELLLLLDRMINVPSLD